MARRHITITPEQPHIGFKDLSPILPCFNSTRIGNVQWCTTAQHNAAPDRDSFATKSVYFCYVGGMKVRSSLSPDVPLSGETRHFTE
ncbi:hypothetical protein TNCV_2970571 [Trichonephila clavipes]|nr:hypothetical protein TNCV_2970571 [Trichonephila clavipes]